MLTSALLQARSSVCGWRYWRCTPSVGSQDTDRLIALSGISRRLTEATTESSMGHDLLWEIDTDARMDTPS